ncbi:MAG: DNA translocase FtsK 4TM domain-containing protein, partial [Rhodospirillales bacterium]|nr:DNA translocase FtsK 4TM domain-containing protein [Rhodospirillales bacterium]
MARTLLSGGSGALLPAGAIDFLKRRLAETAGLVLFAGSGAILGAVATYAPGDPSLNSASDGLVRNLWGIPGAYLADILVQSAGVVSILPALVLTAWGWRLFSKQPVRRPGWRLLALVLSILLLAMALSPIAAPNSWLMTAGFGGFIGGLLLEPATSLAIRFGGEQWMVATLAAALGTPALVFALGLTWGDCLRIWHGGSAAAQAAYRASIRARELISGIGMTDTDNGKRTEPSLDSPTGKARKRVAPKPPEAAETAIDLVAPKKKARTGRRAQAARQGKLALEPSDQFQFPPLELLEEAPQSRNTVSEQALTQNAKMLESVLEDFGVRGEIVKVRPGPVVTLYELEPAPGTKTSRVIGLSDDIARSMSAVSVRAAVIPGRNVIGIELPNVRREIVHLRELLSSEPYEKRGTKLTLALGKDIGGAPVVVDLARMPHLKPRLQEVTKPIQRPSLTMGSDGRASGPGAVISRPTKHHSGARACCARTASRPTKSPLSSLAKRSSPASKSVYSTP